MDKLTDEQLSRVEAQQMWDVLVRIASMEPYQHSETCCLMHRLANQVIGTVRKPDREVWELESCTDFREANGRAHEGWEVITVNQIQACFGPNGESIREGYTEWHFKRKVTKSS